MTGWASHKKYVNVANLIGRFQRVVAANPEAPIARYCAARIPALEKALERHRG